MADELPAGPPPVEDEPDLLYEALEDALMPVTASGTEAENHKINKRIREYFRKAGKSLEYSVKPWHVLINEYADCVFASIFQALGGRPWIAQADFLMVLDVGIKHTFPPHVLTNVPLQVFERTVLAAHDRAFEEQRYLPILWEIVCGVVADDRLRKRIYTAVNAGRMDSMVACQDVLPEGPDQVKEFVAHWIDGTVLKFSKETQGYPESLLPEAMTISLFHAILEAGSLPQPPPCTGEGCGAPPLKWPYVDYTVRLNYIKHGRPDFGAPSSSDGTSGGRGRPRRGADTLTAPPPPAPKRPAPDNFSNARRHHG
eukprot:NODE_13834_length_1144_cov_2.961652.p1 GENE.NODE_13834_length_1144_cov_2.961652~~NODE_13834_length_1144_cov_2.961652.p1  ORF type:complete len:313 (-),score=80.64 NODE_13834_length_1144_cov_2.961652:97-1035(-)